jgi:uncharacterized short protein YbdD (DUF466 family)
MRRLADVISRLARVVRRVIGAPDYERYLAHACSAHPGVPPLTRAEFAREALARRYDKGASRCC